jgi:signal peptidase I
VKKKLALGRYKYVYLKLTIASVLIAIFIKIILLDFYRVDSISMIPNLLPGDRVIGFRLNYGVRVPELNINIFYNEPKFGDVVSIYKDDKIYIKRISALPNSKLYMRVGTLILNNEVINRTYATDVSNYKYLKEDVTIFDEYYKNKRYFVAYSNKIRPRDFSYNIKDAYMALGDNRTNSIDSRTWGEIKKEQIFSKIFMIWWSYDVNTKKIRWDRIGKLIK